MYDFVINLEIGEIFVNFIMDRELIVDINFKVVVIDFGDL